MLTCVSLGEVFGRREDKSRETGGRGRAYRSQDAAFWGAGEWGLQSQGRESLEGKRLTCKRVKLALTL